MITTTEPTSTIRYAVPNDVFASLEGGGSISIEEYPASDLEKAAGLAQSAAA